VYFDEILRAFESFGSPEIFGPVYALGASIVTYLPVKHELGKMTLVAILDKKVPSSEART
jgi:hypothetical protein